MTAARSPSLRFLVQGEETPYLTRDAAIASAVKTTREVGGYAIAVERVEGSDRRVLGKAVEGRWLWSEQCGLCLGAGTIYGFPCKRCAGKGWRVP